MNKYFRQVDGKWCGWFEKKLPNKKTLIVTSEGKSEKHAETMLNKKLKRLGIDEG